MKMICNVFSTFVIFQFVVYSYAWIIPSSCNLNAKFALKRASLLASSQAAECDISCPNAPKCSGAYRAKGCDGTGKIQGGIATVPFLSWWPIKVFRPCPSYLEAGYVYRREGQTMEQVLFSEPSYKMKQMLEERAKSEAKMLKVDSLTKELQDSDADGSDSNSNEGNMTEQDQINQAIREKFGKK
jgi:hypothetical protein